MAGAANPLGYGSDRGATMTWLLVLAWIVLLGTVAILAQQAFGFNLDEAAKRLMALPLPERAMAGAAALMGVFLVGASVWQSGRLAQRSKVVKGQQMNLDRMLAATVQAEDAQRGYDSAAESLDNSEPVQAIASLHKRLSEAEERAAFHQSRNESVDLHQRLEDLRQRQHALRKQLGQVTDKRREIEPVFGELKQRQLQLEEALAEIETDDNRNSLAGRVKDVSNKVGLVQTRLKTLEDSWEALGRFKQEFDRSKTQLVRLQDPETGLAAMVDDLLVRRDQLADALAALETHNNDKLVGRVDALAKSKVETEQSIVRLDDCFAILNTIRREFGELEERRAHLEKALAEVETDPAGRSLTERQNELNEFAAQTRVRVRVLQDSATALNGFRQEVDKSQAALVPLRAPADGIEALIADLQVRRDQLISTLNEIEVQGEQKLSARVEALYRSKIETEQRIAQVVEQFAKLDTIRNEIGGLFAKLNGTLDRLR
jgi:chromosome segregation ATPase